jgi:hypothetical protein
MTSFAYDSAGRLTQIDGPLSGSNDVTVLEYFSSSGSALKDGFLQNFKRKKDTTNYLVTTVLDYDFWGNAIAVRSPDADATNSTGTVSCSTFSSARGHLTQRREAMNGQSDCATTHSSDITTSWTRDSALRLTQLTRADASCYFYEHDSKGRLIRAADALVHLRQPGSPAQHRLSRCVPDGHGAGRGAARLRCVAGGCQLPGERQLHAHRRPTGLRQDESHLLVGLLGQRWFVGSADLLPL